MSVITIPGVEDPLALQRISTSLLSAIETGKTANSWLDEIESDFLKEGIADADYIRIVFYYYHARFWAHRRWEQQRRTQRSRPYLQFITIAHGEPVERQISEFGENPLHASLDGIIRRVDDPIWPKIYPPIDFKCRCMVLSVSEDEISTEGLTVTPDEVLEKLTLPKLTGLPKPRAKGI
jgi:hypothetical protein